MNSEIYTSINCAHTSLHAYLIYHQWVSNIKDGTQCDISTFLIVSDKPERIFRWVIANISISVGFVLPENTLNDLAWFSDQVMIFMFEIYFDHVGAANQGTYTHSRRWNHYDTAILLLISPIET